MSDNEPDRYSQTRVFDWINSVVSDRPFSAGLRPTLQWRDLQCAAFPLRKPKEKP